MKDNQDTGGSGLKERLGVLYKHIKKGCRWLVRKDVPTFVLFVGLSTVIWWGQAMSSEREAVITMPVIYTDVPEQVVFSERLPEELRVTVRDNGKQLRRVRKSRPELTLSLGNQLTGQEGTVRINAEIIRPKLLDILPGSTIVLQLQPEDITVSYHKQQEKTVDVKVCVVGVPAAQYQMCGAVEVVPEEVHIYGKKSDIRAVREVSTVALEVADVRDTVRQMVDLVVPEGLRVVPSSVMVTLVSEKFTEKVYTLPVTVVGCPKGESVRLFPQKVDVQVRVGMSHFAEVHEDDFRAVCRYPKSEQTSLPVEVMHSNPYVTLVRSNPSELEYIIEK